MAGAVVTAHGELLVLAVVPLVLLVLSPRGTLPDSAEVTVALSADRCVEGDDVELLVAVRVEGVDRVDADPELPEWTTAVSGGG